MLFEHGQLGSIALGHNGNLVNTSELRADLSERGVEFETTTAKPERGRVRHVTLVPSRGAVCTVRRIRSAEPSAPV